MTLKYPEPAIYELLKGFCDGRVYHMRAPQNVEAPFIVYQEVDSQRTRHINGPDGIAQSTIQVDVYSEDSYEIKDIAMAAEQILDGFMGEVQYGNDSPRQVLHVNGISRQSGSSILDTTEEPTLSRSMASYLVTYYTRK